MNPPRVQKHIRRRFDAATLGLDHSGPGATIYCDPTLGLKSTDELIESYKSLRCH